MGLTKNSSDIHIANSNFYIQKRSPNDKIIAIAGNPNVGKSTLFNNLTGLNQHTGNWPGKTVSNAQGYLKTKKNSYVMVDIPGTYSLMAHSTEEEIARNFICFGNPDAVIIVCDATCLERNLNLVLQTLEITTNVIVCVNMMDEAIKKKIRINLKKIEKELGVPVIGTTACKKNSLHQLMDTLDKTTENINNAFQTQISYDIPIENAISLIQKNIPTEIENSINTRWLSLRLLDYDTSLIKDMDIYLKTKLFDNKNLSTVVENAKTLLLENNISFNGLRDRIVSGILAKAESICKDSVIYENTHYNDRDKKIDQILTSKLYGYPIMIILLAFVFWLTITGANYPSQMLASFFNWLENPITTFFHFIHMPNWLNSMLVLGIYKVLTWVISVMLPPMAIFFPLFTLLEDSGYLPRIAYNLDKRFKKCCACGKQALTMCMGFGCNAAGIIGCRIIDSPRERLLAIITNNFVPCNGRFPTLIAIITMFFIGIKVSITNSILSALALTAIILLGIVMTFAISKILSKTILKGIPSAFTLELPPYRKPQIGKVIVHSIFDRTLFVLGRAIIVAAPAGLIIWIMGNTFVDNQSLLSICSNFLDPFAHLFGMDGVILIAFILGFPANEIVVPIMIMAYLSQRSLVDMSNLGNLKELFVQNGWTWITAVSTMLFSLMHWPCSTTLLTIHKETQSKKWTLVSFLIPTITGLIICFLFTTIARLF